MRIGFVGAQGTGKSTLITALKKVPDYFSYNTPMSPSRTLHTTYGFDLNHATPDVQLSVLTLQCMNTLISDNSFLDRTVLDHMAYLFYYVKRGKSLLPTNVMSFIVDSTVFLISQLDGIVFLRPSFPLEEDGVRVTSKEQQLEIDMEMSRLMGELKVPPQKILSIKGYSVEERVDKVKDFMAYLSYEKDTIKVS